MKTTKAKSQTRQSNGCKHVGGLCLIDESKKAGKCVQTCKKCGWIRMHGERFYSPPKGAWLDESGKVVPKPEGEIEERVVTTTDTGRTTRVLGGRGFQNSARVVGGHVMVKLERHECRCGTGLNCLVRGHGGEATS